MNLRSKMLLGVFGSLFILLPIIYFIIADRLEHGFGVIENDAIAANTNRVKDALNELVQKLLDKQADWAAWDDTYDFINDRSKDYEESNLNDETFTNSLKINLMYFVNLKGEVVFKKMVDDQTGKEMTIPQEFDELISPDGPLLGHQTPTDQVGGLILTSDGLPFVVASRPIVTSSVSGPIRGTLVWGYYLRPAMLDHLSQITHLNFKLLNFDNTAPREILSKHEKPSVIKNTDSNTIRGILRLPDLYAAPRFLLQVETDRKIYQQGQTAIRTVLYILAVAIFVTGFILTVFLRKEILNPLSRVNINLDAISAQKNPSARLPESGSDEIGELTRHINAVLTALEEEHGKFLQSQKMEAIGKLAGGMAHDFNNILGGILGYASLLKQKFAADEKAVKQLGVIVSSAERGAQITRELLGFARRGKYEKKPLNLNANILSVIVMLEATLGKDIVIIPDLALELSNVEGDTNQVFQVLLNLAVNARDAMPNGGRIGIKTENVIVKPLQKELELPAGEYARVAFSDEGTGIADDIKDKIFEPFFSTKPSQQGTGLGLSMISGIMQNHGGNIVLARTSPKGTEFHLYFPVSKSAKKVVALPESERNKPKTAVANPANLKILIVDDEPAMRDVIKETFEAAGNQVFCAANGKEAVDLFRKHKNEIDVIVLDLIMPEMDGVAAYKVMRQFMARKITVIFSSGYTANNQIATIRKNDGVEFIQKPYQPQDLLNLVNLIRSQPA